MGSKKKNKKKNTWRGGARPGGETFDGRPWGSPADTRLWAPRRRQEIRVDRAYLPQQSSEAEILDVG